MRDQLANHPIHRTVIHALKDEPIQVSNMKTRKMKTK